MRITCSKCGKAVSPELPQGTTIRAWVECPECCARMPSFDIDILRDEFAGRAISLFPMDRDDIKSLQAGEIPDHRLVADFCYDLADAMIAEREKGEGGKK